MRRSPVFQIIGSDVTIGLSVRQMSLQVEGKPVYNPNGKYIVKLLVNGLWRKVEVDDLVPVMATGGQLHPHAPLLPSAPLVF